VIDGSKIVAVTKVGYKGHTRIPYTVRKKLDIKNGEKLVVLAVDDLIILKRLRAFMEETRTDEEIKKTLKETKRIRLKFI
jgi:AbrB family looped-hinge helix DNA binding protein